VLFHDLGFGPVENARLFFDLERLFADMQRELDASWTVINEIYGLHGKEQLDKFGLSIRRFRSSLDEPIYRKSLPFVPQIAKFQAKESSLLPKLIGPLYRDEPKYGVRELLQNAVDAVSEFEVWCDSHSRDVATIGTKPLRDGADVVISVDSNADGTGIFLIEDRGTGMTVDPVVNYFPTAGASFRDSALWRKEYLDDSNHSTLIRSGRFGVGALAAFPLLPRDAQNSIGDREDLGWIFQLALSRVVVKIGEVSAVEEDDWRLGCDGRIVRADVAVVPGGCEGGTIGAPAHWC